MVSNGLGYVTPTPAFGLPAGNFIYHWLAAYLEASSKCKNNFTLTYGVLYVRDRAAATVTFSRFRNSTW